MRSLGLSLAWKSCRHTQKAFRGYNLYKYVWKPAIGLKLHAEQEPDNSVDEVAMKVVKNNETVGHLPREYSRILWYNLHCTWRKDTRGSDWLQTFSCSSKAKINR